MSVTQERFDVDVAVVGAGLAGLVAARELGHAGLTAVVLEARDRIAGRVWVDRGLGHDLEMGGGWVHWTQPHVWAELRRYGIGIVAPPPLDSVITDFGGRRVREDADAYHARLFAAMRPLEEAARELFPLPHEPLRRREAVERLDGLDLPRGLEALGVAPADLPLLISHWGSYVSGFASDGALTFALRLIALAGGSAEVCDEASGTFTIEGGTRALADAIHADVAAPILLETPVERIEQGAGGVTLSAGSTIVGARAAIVTVPINALRGIDLLPALDGPSADAAAVGQASRGVKAWVRVADRGERYLAVIEDGAPLTHLAVDREDGDSRLLVCFGPDARAFDPRPAAVQETLRRCVPDAVVEEVVWHDWVMDPYARETWLWLRPGQLTTAYPAFREPFGRVVFAGGDYADGWAGHMDGAIESGLRAARLSADLAA